jgi:hypothetical protein
MARSETPKGSTAEAGRDVPPLAIDPLILQAAREVDPTLLDWALGLSPRERLRACSNATKALDKYVRASSTLMALRDRLGPDR